MFKIYTQRLLLRPFVRNDAIHLFQLNSDTDVLKYTGDVPFKNLEDAEELIIRYDQFAKYKMGRFSVIEKSTDKFLGWCGLKFNKNSKEVDLGFRFFKEYWNKGFATESSLACIEYGFNSIGLKSIIGRAQKANLASIKILQKVVLKFER